MKRYETMSKEEVMAFFERCGSTGCKDCAADMRAEATIPSATCAFCYLNEEMPEPFMVRRYQNICCKQDLTEMLDVIRVQCAALPCNECAFRSMSYCATNRFIDYLCELEPERPAEWYKEAKYDKSRKQKA